MVAGNLAPASRGRMSNLAPAWPWSRCHLSRNALLCLQVFLCLLRRDRFDSAADKGNGRFECSLRLDGGAVGSRSERQGPENDSGPLKSTDTAAVREPSGLAADHSCVSVAEIVSPTNFFAGAGTSRARLWSR